MGSNPNTPPGSVYGFGVNKQREIERLVFEIAKRERVDVVDIFDDLNIDPDQPVHFNQIKSYLLKRRFPSVTRGTEKVKFPLFKLDLNPRFEASFSEQDIYPKNIYIEEAVAQSSLALRLKRIFPKSDFKQIRAYKDYVQTHPYSLDQYNERLDHFFLIQEKYDFFKKMPVLAKLCFVRVSHC